jgi:hypothetical protein
MLAAGCQGGLPSYQKPELLYLRADTYTGIYVEVDTVQGCRPCPEALDAMKEFLDARCRKLDGVKIVRKAPIPAEEARGASPDVLALRHMQGAPASAEKTSAYLYVLFYDSRRIDGKRRFPYVLTDYPCAIFVDTRSLGSPDLNRHVLLHEAGHVLGLTKRAGGTEGAHCSNPQCTMYATVSPESLRRDRVAMSSAPPGQYHELCDACLRELQDDIASPAGPTLRFHGPVLVREERGYWVAMLPGYVGLFISPEQTFDASEFVRRAATDLASSPSDAEAYRGAAAAPDRPGAEARAAIDRASHDPHPFVRELARGLR